MQEKLACRKSMMRHQELKEQPVVAVHSTLDRFATMEKITFLSVAEVRSHEKVHCFTEPLNYGRRPHLSKLRKLLPVLDVRLEKFLVVLLEERLCALKILIRHVWHYNP